MKENNDNVSWDDFKVKYEAVTQDNLELLKVCHKLGFSLSPVGNLQVPSFEGNHVWMDLYLKALTFMNTEQHRVVEFWKSRNRE